MYSLPTNEREDDVFSPIPSMCLKQFQTFCLLCTSNFKCLYSCGRILSNELCIVLLNEHFALWAHMVTQILYSHASCVTLCFKQLIPNSNSAQPQPAWFIAETVTSIHINSHICAPHSNHPPPCLDTIQKLKQWYRHLFIPTLFLPPSLRRAQM